MTRANVAWRRSSALRLFFFLLQPRNRHDLVFALDLDDANALRPGTGQAHIILLETQNHSLLRDDEKFVALKNVDKPNDRPVPLRGVNIDDAETSSRRQPVFFEFCPLPVSALG